MGRRSRARLGSVSAESTGPGVRHLSRFQHPGNVARGAGGYRGRYGMALCVSRRRIACAVDRVDPLERQRAGRVERSRGDCGGRGISGYSRQIAGR
jgi:hypothetical protein